MKRSLLLILLFVATPLAAEWQRIASGVHYQRFREGRLDVHVARVDISRSDLRVVSTREEDRGRRVSDFAKRNKALVAINADYFDQNMRPIGLAIGPCGPWEDTKDTAREAVIAFGPRRAEVFPEKETMEEPEPWMSAAVSGWPTLVTKCRARTSKQLPGSDSFTRRRHPRTAIGFSKDGKRMYLVVADGRREKVPGMTLAELASWMREELAVCEAVNLDGGGSSAMWVKDKIVNNPSDGKERRVADHIAVVRTRNLVECDEEDEETDRAIAGANRSPNTSRSTSPNGTTPP
jgi:exopolysaccharide biosynthesis protein